jgi:hypothetical protein
MEATCTVCNTKFIKTNPRQQVCSSGCAQERERKFNDRPRKPEVKRLTAAMRRKLERKAAG